MTLCDNCHERPATTHIIAIGEEGQKVRDLCNVCFEASATPEDLQFEEARKSACCQYCGGQPCAGGTDPFALITGVQRMKFMCMPCSLEHNRYIQQELGRASSNRHQQEQMAALRALDIAADKHMKQWVYERDSQ